MELYEYAVIAIKNKIFHDLFSKIRQEVATAPTRKTNAIYVWISWRVKPALYAINNSPMYPKIRNNFETGFALDLKITYKMLKETKEYEMIELQEPSNDIASV